MSKENSRIDIIKKMAVYQIPGMDTAAMRWGVPYRTIGKEVRTMDIYYPPEAKSGTLAPAYLAPLILAKY